MLVEERRGERYIASCVSRSGRPKKGVVEGPKVAVLSDGSREKTVGPQAKTDPNHNTRRKGNQKAGYLALKLGKKTFKPIRSKVHRRKGQGRAGKRS